MKKTEIIFGKDQLTIIEKSNVSIIQYNNIVGIFCEHHYLNIVAVNKKRKLIFHSLKEISQSLPFPFVMCSRSAIVNLTHVVHFKSGNSNCFIELDNGLKIIVPRRKKDKIVEKMRINSTI